MGVLAGSLLISRVAGLHWRSYFPRKKEKKVCQSAGAKVAHLNGGAHIHLGQRWGEFGMLTSLASLRSIETWRGLDWQEDHR